MLKTSQEMITRINNLLSLHRQSVRVVEWTGAHLTLSTGIVLHGNARARFINRTTSSKTNVWISNMDKLLAGEITEREIRSLLSSIGGKAVQEKFGSVIKLNLNTGVSWNTQKVRILERRGHDLKKLKTRLVYQTQELIMVCMVLKCLTLINNYDPAL